MTTAAFTRPDYAREIKSALTDVRGICERLGLLTGRGSFVRQASGLIIRCPWHEEKTPSCSVRIAGNGTIAVKCHGCNETGDVLTLIAVANGLSTLRDFRAVMRAGAELAGLWGIVQELDTGEQIPDRPKVVAPRFEPEAERDYPPGAEVRALIAACVPVTDDAEVAAHLTARAIDPELVADANLAFALPVDAVCPRWASYQGTSWRHTGHRIVLPMRDASGLVVSVRGWRVGDAESPKRLPPGGHKAGGIVLADGMGAAFLAGKVKPRVLVLEGEPDFVVAATWRMREPTACIGIVSGSWTPAIASRFSAGQSVLLWTDRDRAGDAYAKEITMSLLPRGCVLGRWSPKETE